MFGRAPSLAIPLKTKHFSQRVRIHPKKLRCRANVLRLLAITLPEAGVTQINFQLNSTPSF